MPASFAWCSDETDLRCDEMLRTYETSRSSFHKEGQTDGGSKSHQCKRQHACTDNVAQKYSVHDRQTGHQECAERFRYILIHSAGLVCGCDSNSFACECKVFLDPSPVSVSQTTTQLTIEFNFFTHRGLLTSELLLNLHFFHS